MQCNFADSMGLGEPVSETVDISGSRDSQKTDTHYSTKPKGSISAVDFLGMVLYGQDQVGFGPS